MSKGYLVFVLHAHLPFVRHPKHARFLQENWLFNAISESFLPILRMFNRLKCDNIPFRLTLCVSPTLSAMLTDSLLQERYIQHLERLIDLGEHEIKRTSDCISTNSLARIYKDFYQQNLVDFKDLYRKNILKELRSLERENFLEIITTSATHCFLPLFQEYPETIEAQIQTAVISHDRIFKKDSVGIWLPECGYFPGLEKHLKMNNIKYFLSTAHGILFADKRSKYGVYAPMACPNGVSVFARDIPSSKALWSVEETYSGDFSYRDFNKDIGYELPLDYIGPYIHPEGVRIKTGYRYFAITNKTEERKPYNITVSRRKAEEHSENYLYNRIKQINKLSPLMDRPPVLVCPSDAELFGHWWYEGITWLEFLIRKIHSDQSEIELITPSDYLKMYPENQKGIPSFSSWGNQGYAEMWLDGSNDWIYRHIHKAIERMTELVERYPDIQGLKERALNQAAREVLLSEASDWPFLMKTGTMAPYAVKRIKEHLYNFTEIYENLCRNTVNTEWLTGIEKRNNIFPDIDYRIFEKNKQISNVQ